MSKHVLIVSALSRLSIVLVVGGSILIRVRTRRGQESQGTAEGIAGETSARPLWIATDRLQHQH